MSDRVAYLGHATVLIEIDGRRILTDPVLRPRILHIRRYAQMPAEGDHQEIDAVLISHGHPDHLDPPSLRRVGRELPLIVPRGLGRLLRRRRFRQIIELSAGESVQVAGLTIRATPAVHDGRRMPLGPAVAALGYVIEGSSSAYFAGDTDLFEEMSEIGPGLDVALLPIAGWGPRVGPGHLDPEGAARAAALLSPRIAIPIHWGTLRPAHHRQRDPAAPAREFERLVRELAPGVEPRVPEPGEFTRIS
jgi:L-ascorbate metabolism protein UlaG (beta-lactamase superfamily)